MFQLTIAVSVKRSWVKTGSTQDISVTVLLQGAEMRGYVWLKMDAAVYRNKHSGWSYGVFVAGYHVYQLKNELNLLVTCISIESWIKFAGYMYINWKLDWICWLHVYQLKAELHLLVTCTSIESWIKLTMLFLPCCHSHSNKPVEFKLPGWHDFWFVQICFRYFATVDINPGPLPIDW